MVFGLFKEKLSSKNHKDIINYLIIEEAEQQWNYHKKNNFEKDAFRGIPFSKQTISMFIQDILKMNVDEDLLLGIVDLGFRRAKEIVDEYKELEKTVHKLKGKDLEQAFAITSRYTEFYLKQNQEIGGYNQIVMQSGYKSIDFNYRSEVYQVMCQNIRNLDLHIKLLRKIYKDDNKKIDEVIKNGDDWFAEIGKTEQQKFIKKYEEKVYKIVNSRNKNNLL
mgnify:CR=1 FL=1